MGIKGLHSKEICDIIKTCARSGVSEVSLGDFNIKFSEPNKPLGTKVRKDEGTHSTQLELGTTPKQQETEQIDLLQKRALEDLAQAQTLIDSPSRFEEDLIDNMLYDKGSDDDPQNSRRVREAL